MTYIKLKNISLNYPLYLTSSMSIRKAIFEFFLFKNKLVNKKKPKHIKALDRISIELKPGDRLGVTGDNGAGKSSLLRVISGIYPPTSGKLQVEGKISSLLDIFFGVNLDATGRENILIRGILIGLSKEKINEISDKIIEFVDIGEFIDFPLKTYSTGMKMRLAFAISIYITSDILILDEWLSVGDKTFVKKAEKALRERVSGAQIVIYASHSKQQIERICNKVINLKKGRISSYNDFS